VYFSTRGWIDGGTAIDRVLFFLPLKMLKYNSGFSHSFLNEIS